MADSGKKGVTITESKTHRDSETRYDRLVQTGRYDRKAIRARIGLENWIFDQVNEMYNDANEAPEINIDEVLTEDEDERSSLLRNLLATADNSAGVAFFVKELLKKLTEMQREYGNDLSGKGNKVRAGIL